MNTRGIEDPEEIVSVGNNTAAAYKYIFFIIHVSQPEIQILFL